ncbi:hypothetical protein [Novosphingobium sp.]|uniref:hypothetical protein n=1 Tax=Novosphingobium sp. TaxID=1874826 RepID=UPI003BA8C830
MRRRFGVLPALLLLSAPTCLPAQPVPAQAAEPAEPPATVVAATPALPCDRCIPALAPVDLVLDTDLGSKISKTGETFAFHLARPIVIDGHELVPAGTPGQGEVIHAKKAGGSGTAGELVLAARYLSVGSQRLRLRSMHIAQRSEDAIGKVDAFNAATVMSPVPVALVGFAITGRNNVFPKGTPAIAKTAEVFHVPSSDGGGATSDTSTRPATPPVGP